MYLLDKVFFFFLLIMQNSFLVCANLEQKVLTGYNTESLQN